MTFLTEICDFNPKTDQYDPGPNIEADSMQSAQDYCDIIGNNCRVIGQLIEEIDVIEFEICQN